MSWIESHQKLKEDLKTAAVAAEMGWNLYECIGRLHVFWWWCVDHLEDGDLRRYNDVVIASIAGVAAVDAKRFMEAMVTGAGTPDRPDGFFERAPYFRIRNWWKFVRRFMQKRYERTPDKWRTIARAYGAMEGGESAGSAAGSAAGSTAEHTNQPTNPPTYQQTLEAGGGGRSLIAGASAGGVTAEPRSESGRFALPRTGGLPTPLFPQTAKGMVEQCKKEMASIRGASKKEKKIEVIGGERQHTGWSYEPEAAAALEAWKRRIEEIERATS